MMGEWNTLPLYIYQRNPAPSEAASPLLNKISTPNPSGRV
jgi:hypothetical protein